MTLAILNEHRKLLLQLADIERITESLRAHAEPASPKLFSETDIDSEVRRRHLSLSRYDVVRVRIAEARPKK